MASKCGRYVIGVLPSGVHILTFGEKLYKSADVLACSSDRALYGGLASMNRHPEYFLKPEYCSDKPVDQLYPALAGFGEVEWVMLMDTLNLMVGDVLVKIDCASMASSVKVRAPFLDPDVYGAACNCQSICEFEMVEENGRYARFYTAKCPVN
ncbi:asparagine synthase [Marinobacter pelagius]|uniref:Asparagine synthase n=1 Tax=Marinobacter pelagius TaxID=379482 RepID=A0A366GDJ1_9GAMM|nr:asparagine synthase-related protein [Marinobacter pelagius]RBP25013.1 asparagine synthase [Marinobacter pelagius]